MTERLPAIKAKDLIRYLCNQKGFVIERIRGSHYQLRHPATSRRVTIPMHRDEIKHGTLHEIMASTGLSAEELHDV